MKKIGFPLFIGILTIIIVGLIINPVTDYLANLLRHEPVLLLSKVNEYYRDVNFKYVKQNDSFIPYSKKDLRDIIYTVLNRGYQTFTFYCPVEYPNCIHDISELSTDREALTHISNFISPFNSFKNFRVIYSNDGEITLEIESLYTKDMISAINKEIDQIMAENLNDEMDLEEKILIIHDYIVNKTKYDIERLKTKTSPYQSNTAYGPLLQGYGLCGGYADAMALFLDRLKVPNFKVATEIGANTGRDGVGHVWNAVYYHDNWLHLDLTWDDPYYINNPEKNELIHKFYLITTETLVGYKITEHDFDRLIYRELAT